MALLAGGFLAPAPARGGEVGTPTILATWAVIAAILPMAFVGGLMGPYMRPIPIGSSAAMLFSLIIAFTVTPWAAIRVLRKKCTPAECAVEPDRENETDQDHSPDDFFTRLYHKVMEPLLGNAAWRLAFFLGVGGLLLGACSMVYFGLVKVKMLPFDNKSEFQVILDLPEGSTLEETTRVVASRLDDAILRLRDLLEEWRERVRQERETPA